MRQVFTAVLRRLPAPIATRAHYFAHHKRLPRLRNPTGFNEKIVRRKLLDRDPRLPLRADKIAVKAFVAQTLGEAWVTPLLWAGSTLPPRSDRAWALPFVVKASNGSGANAFVRNEAERDWRAIEKECQKWLTITHGDWACEWLYGQIEPRLLVEPYLGSVETLPADYKFFVFHGRVEFIQVDTDRQSDHKRKFFDRRWTPQTFSLAYKLERRDIPPPNSLEAMIGAAERLAEDLPFVRVDFYEIDGKPVFGEMTFYPGSGIERFDPVAYDSVLGRLWR